jgi:dTMP kinase
LWLDVDIEVGLSRKRADNDIADRIELEAIAFHRRVQQGYSQLQASQEKIVRIDASLNKEAVQKMIPDNFKRSLESLELCIR